MKHPLHTWRTGRGALAIAFAASALAGCFGGGDDDVQPVAYSPQTADTPPDSASASSSGLLLFIASLEGLSLDGREPFNLDAFTSPADNADAQAPIVTSIDG